MSYVARCETCGVIEQGDLEAVGDAAEDHERFHDVRVERVATDGGQDVRSEWTLVCTDCDWEDQLVADGHPRDGPPREVEDHVRKHKGTVDWSHVVRVEGRRADEDQEIDPSLLTDGGVHAGRYRHQCVDAVRTHTGVGDQNNICVNDTPGCPGPDAGGGELPCSACFLQGGDVDA